MDPLCSSSLFRLSTCYEQERDYVNAYDYFRRATALLPLDQRAEHRAKFLRLKEQSDDIKSNIIRQDPLEVLPLEIVIEIMKHGLDTDRHFVLKSSWVSKHWREVLNNHCPELWGTMVFKTNEVKDHSYDDKRAAWIQRAREHFHTIIFESMMKSYADKVPKACFPLFKHVKKLDVDAGHEDAVLERILYKFRDSCEELEDLRIRGGWFPGAADWTFTGRPHVPAPYPDLHCGFVHGSATGNIRTMELDRINYHLEGYVSQWSLEPIVVTRTTDRYPALRRLCLTDCQLDETKVVDNTTEGAEGTLKPRVDALHRALRGARKLEYLKVTDDKKQARSTRTDPPVPSHLIRLNSLRSAIIPPPSAKCIDIHAPNLTVLRFETTHGSRYTDRPLVPTIEASPFRSSGTAALGRLKHISFHCSASDDIHRLLEWLPYLKRVTTLVIRGEKMEFPKDYTLPPATGPGQGQIKRAQLHFLQTLADNPEWCPRLKDLKLTSCYLAEKTLVTYVQQRKKSKTCASIDQLTLTSCSMLTRPTQVKVERQVTNVVVAWRDHWDSDLPGDTSDSEFASDEEMM